MPRGGFSQPNVLFYENTTHLREYGEGLTRRPLAHPELRQDVLKLFVVDYVVTF